ncbi:hypothetical protein ISS07_02035 [Candidatus Woesearchaeota archaeon]|nr:hypothetical protein [Candidatus Woesearchaeota archaeon]
MIKKIKELMEVNEQIDVIKNNLTYTTSSVDDMKSEVKNLKESMQEQSENIDHNNKEFLKNFSEDLNIIKETRKDFEKELFQFKLLKAQMQKKIIDKFEEEMSAELKIQMESLQGDATQYQELKDNVSLISNQVNNLGEEIDKFMQISRNIKKGDFELTRFSHQLKDMDREKLELMRKIDTLERLVSKQRKHEYITR